MRTKYANLTIVELKKKKNSKSVKARKWRKIHNDSTFEGNTNANSVPHKRRPYSTIIKWNMFDFL